MPKTQLRLGLIGDNIAASQAPRLHQLAGLQNGLEVRYDRLVPGALGVGFDTLLDGLAAQGYHGVNITYPYKEQAAARVQIADPLVRAMGAVNTVLFSAGERLGYNTDYSGFVAAYQRARGMADPGVTCLIGAGGVGRAVAFGLLKLGVEQLRIADRDLSKAQDLANALQSQQPSLSVAVGLSADRFAAGACGLINCTPIGMVGYEGTPLPAKAMAGADWAFDAVYTPQDTQFLQDAGAAGLRVISGYELFISQGVDAWSLFSGLPVNEAKLRADLEAARL